jgi:hypothetical protein
MRTVLVLAFVAMTACRYSGSFTCATDEDCRARGSVGQCQLESNFCAFDDSTCPSGFRYADSAGNDLASSCTAEPMPPDGGVVDASTFDPTTCPPAFTQTLTNVPNARYLLMPDMNAVAFGEMIELCEQQMPGATHAIIVDSPPKAAALAQFIGNTPRVWVGLVQAPQAPAVGAEWIYFTGTPVVASLWASTDMEPDDANGLEGDHHEQAGAFGPMGLYDLPRSDQLPLVCECDGRRSTNDALEYATGEPQ